MEFIKRNPLIFIISGKARSGKNEIANTIKKIYESNNIRCINVSYASYLKEYAKNILNWDGNDKTKPREFLQKLGIELIKNKINDKLLINRIIDDIEIYSYFYDVITISDARLEEEIDSVKNRFKNVIVISTINEKDNDLTDNEKKHITETDLDDYHDYDYKIYNNGDLRELNIKIDKIIKEVDNNG